MSTVRGLLQPSLGLHCLDSGGVTPEVLGKGLVISSNSPLCEWGRAGVELPSSHQHTGNLLVKVSTLLCQLCAGQIEVSSCQSLSTCVKNGKKVFAAQAEQGVQSIQGTGAVR